MEEAAPYSVEYTYFPTLVLVAFILPPFFTEFYFIFTKNPIQHAPKRAVVN